MIIKKQVTKMVKQGNKWLATGVRKPEVISKAEYDRFLANKMTGDRYYYGLTCLGRVPVSVHSYNPGNAAEKLVTNFSIGLKG